MISSLENLNDEELGKLFPIEIVSYNPEWPRVYEKESKLLRNTLGNDIVLRIEHFGSTAVEGLSAKPIIDILIEIPPFTEKLKEEVVLKMKAIEYNFIWRTDEKIPYMNFVKGYTLSGYSGNVFHVHMADKSHPLWDRIYFRDYLRQNKGLASEYEKLKVVLAKKYRNDRASYTRGKKEFVNRVTQMAKSKFSW